MVALNKIALKPKLTALFLLIGLLPLIISGWFANQQAHEALLAKTFAHLETIHDAKKLQVESYIAERMADVRVFSTDSKAIAMLEQTHKVFHELKKQNKVIGTPEWERSLDQNYITWLEDFRKTYGYHDIALIDSDGNILYTAARESDLGDNVFDGALKNSPMNKLFAKAQFGEAIQDFEPYTPSGDEYSSFLGAPIIHNSEKIGLVVFQLPTVKINAIMAERSGMGKTSETYLVGKHEGTISYRSDRSVKEGRIGQKRTSSYIEAAIGGARGNEINIGSTGVQEVISYVPLSIPGLNWAVVGTIALNEVEAPIHALTKTILLLGALLTVLVVGAALVIARSIAIPINALNTMANQIAGGDWSARVVVQGSDEMGQLANAFNRMAQSNEEQFWVKTSVAGLTQIIQASETLEVFASNVIRKLTPLLGCGHGVFYLLDENSGDFRLLGSYGYKERKNLSNRFAPGEGLVGQCALEKQPIMLSGVPSDHIKITTGLGISAPLHVFAMPLLFQEQVLAIIELASFNPFTTTQLNLLDELSTTLGLGLENHNRNLKTVVLLQQTRQQAEEMALQSEELQRANEELHAQSEEMQRANEELQTQSERVRRTNEELEEQSQALIISQEELQSQQRVLEESNRALELARSEVEKKAADLENASRYKSQFLANMSHELRTPLNSLLILAKNFADNEEHNLSKEQIESAKIILSSGRDLLELINDILDLSKIEAGKMALNIGAVDVVGFAEELRTQFKHVAQNKGLLWRVEVAQGTIGMIETDVGKVRQVVKNFLSNAFKFTEKGSVTVSIRTKPDQNGLVIAVADTGIGIPKHKQSLIFEAFQQADGGTSRKYGGTGLGLSISLELARLLGGTIQVESSEGRGSLFSLILPLTIPLNATEASDMWTTPIELERPAKASIRESVLELADTAESLIVSTHTFIEDDRDEIAKGNRFLLVIEDDPHFATIVRDLARKNGYKCLAAATGVSGLELAARRQPIGIILDRGLPDMDGETVMEQLRKNPATRHIPVHIVSAMERNKKMEKGTIGVLEKPVTKEQLKKVLEMFDCHARDTLPRLLLVEDDPTARKLTSNLLENDGIVVVTAANCHEAVHALREESFNCIILDLGLPDCSGFELLERITKDPLIQDLPVVIHSGKELTRDEYNRLRHYTNALVTKGTPRSGERLVEEVATFLQNMPELETASTPLPGQDWKNLFRNKSILLVDDDMRNTFALSRTLEKKGLTVIMAPDGFTALELLVHSPAMISAILMDVMMPELDGNETTQRIRAMEGFRDLPIVGLSAKAMEEDRQHCLDAGMNAFLAKPVDVDQLLLVLKELLVEKQIAG